MVVMTRFGYRTLKPRAITRRGTKRTRAPVRRLALRPSGFTRRRTMPRMASFAAAAMKSGKFRKFNTTLSQKLKTENRVNRRLIRDGGCSILRMCMENMQPLLTLANAGFDNAGYGAELTWVGLSLPPTFQNNTTTVPTPSFIALGQEARHQGVVCFLPQCPSSRACFNIKGIGSTGAKVQRFGVIPNYNDYSSAVGGSFAATDNLSFNQFPMAETYGFNRDAILTVGTTWDSGNTLKVFRSWTRIELENPNYQTGMKVHILIVKLRAIKYNDGADCTNDIPLNTWPRDILGTTNDNQEARYFSYLNECRGKLPSKLFRVLKHKVVVLGAKNANAITDTPSTLDSAMQSTFFRHSNENKVSSPRSTRTVAMSFGPKTIRRTHCSNMSDGLFTFQEMNENWQNQSVVMMYTEPLDTMTTLPNINNRIASLGDTTLGVNYRIFKTHKWKVVNNFSN